MMQTLFRIKFPTKKSTHISISLRSGAWKLQRLPYLKYNVLEWESRFTSGLNAAESTDYIKKYFEQKSFRIKFPIKKLTLHISLSSPGVEPRVFQRFVT